jgi:ribonucleoside-diphosphate reductase alpha chain
MSGGNKNRSEARAKASDHEMVLATEELVLTPNSLKVLEKRYLKKDETGKVIEGPKDLFTRVAMNIASAERFYNRKADLKLRAKEFYDLMTEMDFLPNSPTLMNAGRELQQLSACFVLPIDDSMESIFETLKYTAMIHKSGGGTGFSFSRLRPRDDIVKSTKGISSGPISFMSVFDQATEAIKQGGTRRGANMGILRVDHPNIEDFITCKRDTSKLTNFNISVAITDKFMHALQTDEAYNIINPRKKEVCDRKSARKVFDMIVEEAWTTGEPGVIFIDEINKHNPTPQIGEIESTNPCIAGETLIYTDEGLLRADALSADTKRDNLKVTSDPRLSPNRQTLSASNMFCTGRRKVFLLTTKEGYSIRLTANHKVMTERGWVPAGELVLGDKLHILSRKGKFTGKGDAETGKILGWLVGDGTIKKDRVVLSFFGDEKRELAPLFAEMVNKKVQGLQKFDRDYEVGVVNVKSRDEARVSAIRLFEMAEEYGLLENKHQISDQIISASEEFQRGFLQALFTADGSVQGGAPIKGVCVRLAQSNLELLKRVQQMLLNFGIVSHLYKERRKAHIKFMPDGKGGSKKYHCSEQHELAIYKGNLLTFRREIGFLTTRKNKELDKRLAAGVREPLQEKYLAHFVSLEKQGEEEVYDLHEPQTHSFVANGFVIHNCGEQPLLPFESCNLGSINLAKMVTTTDSGTEVDWHKLKRVVRGAVRFLDNVIDMNKYPLEQIEKMTKGNRKIGLGVMGFADMLIQLNIPYNSDQALKIGEEVMCFIQEEGHKMSLELAEERGPFPNFKGSIYDVPGSPKVRNATVTTVAPTGTISIIAGCSSGIEPLFALVFKRNVMEGTKMMEANKEFEDVARREGFFSDELMEKIFQHGSIQGMAEIPEHVRTVFVTAHDITPEWHLRMEAAFQKGTDNAVSKTINFPNSATVKEIEEAYMLAHKLGCKGVTVYRDGCRENQPMSVGDRKGTSIVGGTIIAGPGVKVKPRPRPLQMKGATMRMMTGCGKLYVTINEDDQGLFEVFSQMGKSGGCAMSQSEAISRLISLSLRSGVDIEAILKQIKGIRCPSPFLTKGGMVLSCPDAIAKALELYLEGKTDKPPMAEEATTLKDFEEKEITALENVVGVCPDCGNAVGYEEGCMLCRFCGWSKCG